MPWLREAPSQILRNGTERWMEGKLRQLKGLVRAPTVRNRGNFNSVLVSSELFRFRDVIDKRTGEVRRELELGTLKNPVGVLPYRAHRAFGHPRQLVIRRTGAKWFVSFSFEHAAPEGFMPRDAAELAYELDLLDDAALARATVGLDRNVKDNCVATSDGRFFHFSAQQQERLQRKAMGAKRHQKRFSRKVKGSKNPAKARQRLAAKHAYRTNLAQDFSHKTSTALVAGAGASGAPRLLVREDLNIAGMTRRPKAKQDPATGKWLRNGASAKAGLNRAILGACWGRIATQLDYKAARRGVLVLKVPAAFTSQACYRCGHTHPDNRAAQRFVCQGCGYAAHADTNAGCNIAAKGIRVVRDHLVVVKPKKHLAKRRRLQAGREAPGVPVEENVSRAKGQPKRAQLAPGSHSETSPAIAPRRRKGDGGTSRNDAPTTAPPGV